MQTGTVVSLRLDKGYFFIRPDDGGGDTFAHCTELDDGLEFDDRLEQRRVKFDSYKTDRGFRASNIQPAD